MNDKDTLKAAAMILTGMGVSLSRIAETMGDEVVTTTNTHLSTLADSEIETAIGLLQQDAPGVQSESASEATPPPGAAAAIQSGGVELDNYGKGIPWDHRIHTSTRKKTQKDVWKRRPGVPDEEFEQVVAELKATMAAPTPTTAQAAPVTEVPKPPVTEVPAAEKVKTMTEKAGGATYETFIAQNWTDDLLIEQGYMVMTDAIPKPPVTAVPTPPAGAGVMTFPDLASLVTPAIHANLITQVEADAEAAKHGVDSMAMLVSRADIVPAVYAGLQQLIASRQQ